MEVRVYEPNSVTERIPEQDEAVGMTSTLLR